MTLLFAEKYNLSNQINGRSMCEWFNNISKEMTAANGELISLKCCADMLLLINNEEKKNNNLTHTNQSISLQIKLFCFYECDIKRQNFQFVGVSMVLNVIFFCSINMNAYWTHQQRTGEKKFETKERVF